MASGSISNRATSRPPWETIVAAAAVASLALWFVEIHTAFGLPAHPLIIHVPDHAEAGEALRFTMVVLTALLVGMLFARKLPPVVNTVLRVLAVLLALVAVFFVIRTGHLGAKLAWGREGGGAPPAGLQGGPGAGQPRAGARSPGGA